MMVAWAPESTKALTLWPLTTQLMYNIITDPKLSGMQANHFLKTRIIEHEQLEEIWNIYLFSWTNKLIKLLIFIIRNVFMPTKN